MLEGCSRSRFFLLIPALTLGCFGPPEDGDTTATPGSTSSDGSSTGLPPGTTGDAETTGGDTTDGPADTTVGPGDSTTSAESSSGDSGDSGSSGTTTGDPFCGDGVVDAGEDCDDMGESATCDADCTLAECGDAFVNASAMELCDDGNADDTDDCVACQPAACGDGFVWAGMEDCDDGNMIDADACTNACALGTLIVSGNSNEFILPALDGLGEVYSSETVDWPVPLSAGVLIVAQDGGGANPPDYQAHLDAGAHLLVAGGSSTADYGSWVAGFFGTAGNVGWHQSSSCVSDYNETAPHPITDLLPDTYEFTDQAISYHMLHFDEVGQPPDTELLAQSCEAGPDNYIMATRRYPSGGTFTYVATDIGNYGNAVDQVAFVEPLLEGYLAYIRSPVP